MNTNPTSPAVHDPACSSSVTGTDAYVPFLIGSERSGTTMLRLMLDHHPMLTWCNEFEYAVDCLNDDQKLPNPQDYARWLSTNRVFNATEFVIDPKLDYRQLVQSFLYQRRTLKGKPRVGAVVHRHFDRILRLWPDARFIHLVRDGRDVARSFVTLGWSGNMWTGGEHWLEMQDLADSLRKRVVSDRWLDVSYETLVRQPEQTLREICRFIDLPYDPAMLQYSDDTTYDAPDPSLLQQWRKKLSQKEIQISEARLGDRLVERGYELSGLPRITVSPLRRTWLKIHHRFMRWRFRLKRYGFRLWLADVTSRRLRLHAMRERTALAINEIDRTFLK